MSSATSHAGDRRVGAYTNGQPYSTPRGRYAPRKAWNRASQIPSRAQASGTVSSPRSVCRMVVSRCLAGSDPSNRST